MKKYLILLLALFLVCGCENKKETPKDTPVNENTPVEEKKEDKGVEVEAGSDEEKRFTAISEYAKKLCEDKTYEKFSKEDNMYTETLANLIANYNLTVDEELFSCVDKENSRIRIDSDYTLLNKDVECPMLLEIDGCQPDVVEGEEEN